MMKLRQITEDIKGSNEPIRQAAKALGGLIQYVYGLGKSKELQALHVFLSQPSPRAWERTKWILDVLGQKAAEAEVAGTADPAVADQMRSWMELGELTSPIVSASVYDLDPAQAKGTPAQDTLSQRLRDKLKLALGPQGYVSALSNMGTMDDNKVKKLLQSTSKSDKGLTKAAKEDLPGVAKKPRKKF